jgi:hypothetical protein
MKGKKTGIRVASAAIVAMMTLGPALAAPPPSFDPRQHKAFAGPPTEILVLGTPHLSGMPDNYKNEQLAPLLDRLAAFRPGLIAIEAVDGPQCEYLKRYEPLHPGAAEQYCLDPADAKAATGLDVPAAAIEADKLLSDWRANPTAAQRRHLAAVFLAAGNYASALVQWLRLAPADRVAGDGLDAKLVDFLKAREKSKNENYAVAATLAARLGLDRVYPVDDHSADNGSWKDPGYGKAFERIWSGPKVEARRAAEAAMQAKLGQTGALLDMYRAVNQPAEAMAAFDSDFGAALADDTSKQYGRQYVAWWETRNLRMVANIRAATALRPGVRVLAIVGASHKGYYESYLAMMHDVKLIDSDAVLH